MVLAKWHTSDSVGLGEVGEDFRWGCCFVRWIGYENSQWPYPVHLCRLLHLVLSQPVRSADDTMRGSRNVVLCQGVANRESARKSYTVPRACHFDGRTLAIPDLAGMPHGLRESRSRLGKVLRSASTPR